MKIVKVEVGQVWLYGSQFLIIDVGAPNELNVCVEYGGRGRSQDYPFGRVMSSGMTMIADEWILVSNNEEKKEKIIPGIPLDPSLPILQAGYLQDRQRKRFKSNQQKV
jgi:hypothetical protein